MRGDYNTLERCNQLVKIFTSSPIAVSFGLELSYSDNGDAIIEYVHQEQLEHAYGDTHGGVLATMIANAGWYCAAPVYDTRLVTVGIDVHMLEPIRKENLRAAGQLVRAGKRLAVAKIEVSSSSKRLVAIGSGTFSRISSSL